MLQKSLFSNTCLCNSSFFSIAKKWLQFRQPKSSWCLEVLPLNNAESYLTAR